MKYDEFLDKLDEYVAQFEAVHRKRPETLDEFVRFVRERKLRRPKGGGLKSVRGLGI